MAASAAGHWVKFFNASGIPSPAAATYAHIFVENRIQNDMIMDLNKEYLREMGIKPMGDIIAILRHAKLVSDQTAREKVLNPEKIVVNQVPIAAVPANPITLSERKTTKLNSSAIVTPLPKPARRVMPEHEGKYKIKLPEGNTERSKEILAKKAQLYSDREAQANKSCVFERLAQNTKAVAPVQVRITGIDPKRKVTATDNNSTNSIFSRLGNKTDEAIITKQIKPILKNSSKNSGIVKAKTVVTSSNSSKSTTRVSCPQKVLLVKKVPLKTNETDESEDSDMDDDYTNYDDNDDESFMECDKIKNGKNEKIVKFASTAEVREIGPDPPVRYSSQKTKNMNSVKSRLGLTAKLHSVKRSYNMKQQSSNINSRSNPVIGKTLRMKADEILLSKELPVHKRLGITQGNNIKKTSNVLPAKRSSASKLSVRRHSLISSSNSSKSTNQRSKTSVFDRLSL